jgi:hypothetical protein
MFKPGIGVASKGFVPTSFHFLICKCRSRDLTPPDLLLLWDFHSVHERRPRIIQDLEN